MPPKTLNLGILAHVDAGKTSLTERLLFDHGAIASLGSVDTGSTQTDSGDLERERGITIRSAVAAFGVGDLQVNLVDTPGHPDFIAEVERALAVLDGAVLVLSAVEGVQAQTRVLMRSLRNLRLPTLLFVNKIDRAGARPEGLLADIRQKLAPHLVPMSAVRHAGTAAARSLPRPPERRDVREQAAEVLAEHDDAVLAGLVEGDVPRAGEVRRLLAAQTAAGLVHPVWFGSALTGTGVGDLVAGITAFLPRPAARREAPARGTVFAVERAGGGEKVALVRMFSGEVRERERLTFRRREPGGATTEFSGRVTRLDVVAAPGTGRREAGGGRLAAGSIGRLRGLSRVRVGDRLGEHGQGNDQGGAHFAPPGLESAVRPRQAGQEAALHAALADLADEDPLIRTRPAGNGATSVLLYGAVQQEVIAERIRRSHGIDPVFEKIRPVYVERPVGVGEASQDLGPGTDEFWATVGLRVEPAPFGSGVAFRRQVEWGALPRAFHRAIEEAALRTLHQGLHGWEVTDCTVTLFRVGYLAPASVAADFRGLTPVILLRALRAAGSRVFEPCQSVEIEIPPDTLGGVVGFLAALGAETTGTTGRGASWVVGAQVPTRLVQDLTAALPGLTHGEGALWSRGGRDRPVRGTPPRRERFDGNPLNYEEYLRYLADRSLSRTAADGG
ncbi:TetM/TetW/TetO/TetS family tetracycline resistance ribosomal protection protein [Streptomyces sp. MP131-18]|uniref:elongation factor G n=1 Tax=Streptomyces sp. MP131-18 TaxID=1857892 RepID=UPI00097C2C3B|nr:TetM/TetW/TetO/TetS family tetracycline resistance ribosomal protection protein [Streptomyces sp. MP131-18]ONK15977.1 Tetracycline resistance protein TetM [Streptomyces sp. MP131-18]